MKTIGVECPTCRRLEDIPMSCLLIEVGDVTGERDGAFASWICGGCLELVGLPVDLAALVDLVSAGATVLDSALEDDRPMYPESGAHGDPLTYDDLLSFHECLEMQDPWLSDGVDRGCS